MNAPRWLMALAVLLLYSYTKRFTRWSHLVLGLALGIAPSAAWIAVRGSLDPRILLLTAAVRAGNFLLDHLRREDGRWLRSHKDGRSQHLGLLADHAWVIDAYQGLLWRDEGASTLYKPWLVMALIGLAGLVVAQAAVRRVRL